MCTLITWVFFKIQTNSVGPGWVRPEISSKFSGGGADAAGLGHFFEEQGSSRGFQQHHYWHSGLSNSLLGEERALLCIVRRLAASWLLPLGAHSTTLFPPNPDASTKNVSTYSKYPLGTELLPLENHGSGLILLCEETSLEWLTEDWSAGYCSAFLFNLVSTRVYVFQSCVILQALHVFKICRCRCRSFLVSNSYSIVYKWGILPPGGSKYPRWVAGTTRFKYMSY